MTMSSMDVSIHCDDHVIIEINISQLTRAKEVIHQVICSRRSMIPPIDLDFDGCVLSVHDGAKLRLLSKESILFSVLTVKNGQSSITNKVIASGFRSKALEALRSTNDFNYLIEKKSLELRYLVSSGGSRLPPDLSSALRVTGESFDPSQINTDNHNLLLRSHGDSSSSGTSDSIGRPSNLSLSEFLSDKFNIFAAEVGDVLRAEKRNVSSSQKVLVEAAEGRPSSIIMIRLLSD
jgi:hypothetical protein